MRRRITAWLRQPLRLEIGGLSAAAGLRRSPHVQVAVRGAPRVARAFAAALPWVLMAAGVTLAVAAAHWEERPGQEGIATLAIEAGAALWFAGAVSLGLMRAPTVLRALSILALTAAGAVLIAAALAFEFDGPALGLSMEFGVGAVAVGLLDVLLLGIVHPAVSHLAEGDERHGVEVRLRAAWPPVIVRPEPAPPPER